ncbi:hypothetical protein [Acinetobacter baumannii]|uniref:hypothetical protein n=1 Tax=Acinetobacter baumannii TaxID=470 RepID=UPI0025A301F4|nr:hypothetical protein [Acinetobacter baumannii]EKU5951618.1 hypothetical protein [Acinetobacter baumannii]ELA8881542.1 hypothetical protein [Acinetobacter baumannii]
MIDMNKEREAFALTEFNTFGLDVKNFKTTGEYFMFIGWLMRSEREKAKAHAVPTWISFKDEEPPLDTSVLICWSDSPEVQPEIDHMTCDEDLSHVWANFYRDPPTHWMFFHKVPSESGTEV